MDNGESVNAESVVAYGCNNLGEATYLLRQVMNK